MKLLRIAGALLFLLSTIAFTGFKFYVANNLDLAGPIISCPNSITTSVGATEEELLRGVTAYDQQEGDVTKSIIIEEISKFTAASKRIITYAAFDSNNNIAKKECELIYSDYSPPRFTLSKPLIFNVGEQFDIIQYMKATDCIDGELTDKIKYDVPSLDFGESEGSYEVEFRVANSAGDTAALPVSVEFRYPNNGDDEKTPEIILSDYLIYIKTGETCNVKSFLKGVKIGQENYILNDSLSSSYQNGFMSINRIQVQSKINNMVPGVYEVKYNMTTDDGYTGTTKLLVVVEE